VRISAVVVAAAAPAVAVVAVVVVVVDLEALCVRLRWNSCRGARWR